MHRTVALKWHYCSQTDILKLIISVALKCDQCFWHSLPVWTCSYISETHQLCATSGTLCVYGNCSYSWNRSLCCVSHSGVQKCDKETKKSIKNVLPYQRCLIMVPSAASAWQCARGSCGDILRLLDGAVYRCEWWIYKKPEKPQRENIWFKIYFTLLSFINVQNSCWYVRWLTSLLITDANIYFACNSFCAIELKQTCCLLNALLLLYVFILHNSADGTHAHLMFENGFAQDLGLIKELIPVWFHTIWK